VYSAQSDASDELPPGHVGEEQVKQAIPIIAELILCVIMPSHRWEEDELAFDSNDQRAERL